MRSGWTSQKRIKPTNWIRIKPSISLPTAKVCFVFERTYNYSKSTLQARHGCRTCYTGDRRDV